MAEHVEVPLEGVAGRLTMSAPGVLSGVKLFVDGQPLPKGGRGTFQIQRADGSTSELKLKPAMTRTLPSLEVDGKLVEMGEKIAPLLLVFVFLPLVLLFVGGALGGGLGGAAAAINMSIVRSELELPIKILICLATGAVAWGIYFVVALALGLALG